MALALALAWCSGCGGTSDRPAGGPELRIVVISLDTLRQDAFERAMPLLAARAARSARVFPRYHSATPITQPTHAVLFTGEEPWRTGVVRNGVALSDERETLAETLARAGFQTGAVVSSWPLSRRFGFDQGFELYSDRFDVTPAGGGQAFYSKAPATAARARQLLDRMSGARQFVFLHFFDPHEPYGDLGGADPPLRPARVAERIAADPSQRDALLASARSAYDGDVRALDRELDGLLERLLDPEGAAETDVIVLSDHGESFGEGQLLGHGEIAPEQIDVPCMVFSPRLEAGRSEVLAGTLDVYATVLALAGLEPRGRGRDLLAAEVPARPVLGMRRPYREPHEEPTADGGTRTVSGARFYLAEPGGTWVGDGHEVSAQGQPSGDADAVRALFGELSLELRRGPEGAEPDAETAAALRALGYVD